MVCRQFWQEENAWYLFPLTRWAEVVPRIEWRVFVGWSLVMHNLMLTMMSLTKINFDFLRWGAFLRLGCSSTLRSLWPVGCHWLWLKTSSFMKVTMSQTVWPFSVMALESIKVLVLGHQLLYSGSVGVLPLFLSKGTFTRPLLMVKECMFCIMFPGQPAPHD